MVLWPRLFCPRRLLRDSGMQTKFSYDGSQDDLKEHQIVAPMRYGRSRFDRVLASDLALADEPTRAAAPQPLSASSEGVPSAGVPIESRSADFALPEDKTITISVIGGPSKGSAYQFSKPRISIGQAGGRADIGIDDPNVSDLHCAVGVRQDSIRLVDMDSTNGTYFNDERVQAAELEHLSEFRVGSSLLLVIILPKC